MNLFQGYFIILENILKSIPISYNHVKLILTWFFDF